MSRRACDFLDLQGTPADIRVETAGEDGGNGSWRIMVMVVGWVPGGAS